MFSDEFFDEFFPKIPYCVTESNGNPSIDFFALNTASLDVLLYVELQTYKFVNIVINFLHATCSLQTFIF